MVVQEVPLDLFKADTILLDTILSVNNSRRHFKIIS